MKSDKAPAKVSRSDPNTPDERSAKEALAVERKLQVNQITRADRCCVREYWAIVERDGTLIRGRNVVRSKRLGTGMYEVVFTSDVSAGVYVASIGRPGISTEPSGEIGVALRCCLPASETNRGVWVDTHDSTGAWSDRAFHLLVMTD